MISAREKVKKNHEQCLINIKNCYDRNKLCMPITLCTDQFCDRNVKCNKCDNLSVYKTNGGNLCVRHYYF